MSYRVRHTGLGKLELSLNGLGHDVSDLRRAFADIAKEGRRLASGFAPRRTGRLSRSVYGYARRNKAVIASDLEYAAVNSYGWRQRGYPGSRYMERASRVLASDAPRRLENAIDQQIRERKL